MSDEERWSEGDTRYVRQIEVVGRDGRKHVVDDPVKVTTADIGWRGRLSPAEKQVIERRMATICGPGRPGDPIFPCPTAARVKPKDKDYCVPYGDSDKIREFDPAIGDTINRELGVQMDWQQLSKYEGSQHLQAYVPWWPSFAIVPLEFPVHAPEVTRALEAIARPLDHLPMVPAGRLTRGAKAVGQAVEKAAGALPSHDVRPILSPDDGKIISVLPNGRRNNSGVTIATGVDVGQWGSKELGDFKDFVQRNAPTPADATRLTDGIQAKIGGYIGKKGAEACKALQDGGPVVLTEEEAKIIDAFEQSRHAKEAVDLYNKTPDGTPPTIPFDKLNPAIQTTLLSIYFQSGKDGLVPYLEMARQGDHFGLVDKLHTDRRREYKYLNAADVYIYPAPRPDLDAIFSQLPSAPKPPATTNPTGGHG